MSKARAWCFTDNTCDESFWNSVDCKYIIYGRETAPTTGQKHLQGYIVFPFAKTASSVRKLFCKAHWEIANGGPSSNINYCSKEGDFVERGEKPAGQGARTDLEAACAIVKSHGVKRLAEEMPGTFVRYARNFTMLEEIIRPNMGVRDWAMEVFWYYGPTGTGKSRAAYTESGPDAYRKMEGKWWDGYTDQENVVFDDFRKNWCTFNELLRILDRYPLRVEFKGGSRQLVARRVWITSCKSPRELYTDDEGTEREDIEQLIRRITVVKAFSQPFQ